MNQATFNQSVVASLLPFSSGKSVGKLRPGLWRVLTRSASRGDRTEFRIELVADGSTRDRGQADELVLQVARWQQFGDDFRMEQLASSGLLFVYSGTVVGPKFVQGAYYTPDDANLGGTFVAWRVDSAESVGAETLAMAIA